MLLKSQTIINQEELVSILEAQLKKAKSRLTELTKADTKIKSIVEELESLLTEHPDYKLLVSERLKLRESEAGETIGPVRIEIDDTLSEFNSETTPQNVVEAYDSLFGEAPPQPAPQVEEKIESPYSDESEIAKVSASFNKISGFSTEKITDSPSQKSESSNETPASETDTSLKKPESLKNQMLRCKTRQELESLKAEIGDNEAKQIWEECSIPEKNYLKCISKAKTHDKTPATLGFKFTYTAPITKIKYEAIYLGHYLHGKPLKGDDKYAILTEGHAIICDKTDLTPLKLKQQTPLSEAERTELEKLISETKPADDDNKEPTAETIAELTFTGLAAGEKPQAVSQKKE